MLDWAVKESDCGLALMSGGSLDGLKRFGEGAALAAGLHLFDAETGDYNVPTVSGTFPALGAILIEWARRRQGLVVAAGNPKGLESLRDLKEKGARVVARQPEAGSYLLLAHLLEQAEMALEDLTCVDGTARSETDLGLAILEGRADAGLAVEAAARTLKLDFVPLADERYDLLMRRRDYFEPPMQSLLAFTRCPAFAERAAQMGGYDLSGTGTVRFNGP